MLNGLNPPLYSTDVLQIHVFTHMVKITIGSTYLLSIPANSSSYTVYLCIVLYSRPRDSLSKIIRIIIHRSSLSQHGNRWLDGVSTAPQLHSIALYTLNNHKTLVGDTMECMQATPTSTWSDHTPLHTYLIIMYTIFTHHPALSKLS